MAHTKDSSRPHPVFHGDNSMAIYHQCRVSSRLEDFNLQGTATEAKMKS